MKTAQCLWAGLSGERRGLGRSNRIKPSWPHAPGTSPFQFPHPSPLHHQGSLPPPLLLPTSDASLCGCVSARRPAPPCPASVKAVISAKGACSGFSATLASFHRPLPRHALHATSPWAQVLARCTRPRPACPSCRHTLPPARPPRAAIPGGPRQRN